MILVVYNFVFNKAFMQIKLHLPYYQAVWLMILLAPQVSGVMNFELEKAKHKSHQHWNQN